MSRNCTAYQTAVLPAPQESRNITYQSCCVHPLSRNSLLRHREEPLSLRSSVQLAISNDVWDSDSLIGIQVCLAGATKDDTPNSWTIDGAIHDRDGDADATGAKKRDRLDGWRTEVESCGEDVLEMEG
jgi:hypothetical protein